MTDPVNTAFAPNQQEAAAALQITMEEFEELKKLEGFPPREKQGWDIAAIQAWLQADAAAVNDVSVGITTELPSSNVAVVTPAVQEEPVRVVRTVILELPVCDPDPTTYIAQQRGHVDFRFDRQTQLPAFVQLHAGLRAENAQFADGKPVESAADVLRYLATLIAGQLTPALRDNSE